MTGTRKHKRTKKKRLTEVLGRLLRIRLVLVLMAIGLVSGLLTIPVSNEESFKIKTIKLVGEIKHNDPLLLRSLVETKMRGNFFTLDLTEVHESLAALPWVAQVSVTRAWPDTLTVNVTEHTPGLILNETHLASDKGKLIVAEVPAEYKGLPRIYGVSSDLELLLERYQEFNSKLAGYNLQISTLKIDERNSVELKFNNEVDLILGRVDQLKRLERFLDYYDQIVSAEANPLDRVDMRYANGFAVRWNQPVLSRTGSEVRLDKKG